MRWLVPLFLQTKSEFLKVIAKDVSSLETLLDWKWWETWKVSRRLGNLTGTEDDKLVILMVWRYLEIWKVSLRVVIRLERLRELLRVAK